MSVNRALDLDAQNAYLSEETMPPETDDTFPDREAPSVPDAPLAIRELTLAVNGMRGDVEKLLHRFDANFDLMRQDMQGFKQSVYEAIADHNKRIAALEDALIKKKDGPKPKKRKGKK